MKSLSIAFLFLCVSLGWADSVIIYPGHPLSKFVEGDSRRTVYDEEITQREALNRMAARWPGGSESKYSSWVVTRATETYTLDDFISTGLFCSLRGHTITERVHSMTANAYCGVCKKWFKEKE